MWPWGERKENKRVQRLEDGLENVKSSLHALDVDMHLLWDKVKVALGRISKRSAILEAAETQPQPAVESSTVNEPPAFAGRMWTQHQKEENERILRRRAGL